MQRSFLAMGATTSSISGPSGLVTVSRGQQPVAADDPDLVALRRLPAVAPLVKPPTLRALFTSRPVDPSLPVLHPRSVSALCREYASLSRHAALPLCEEQRALCKKISGVEALCARVLYLMALRSSELAASVATLRELEATGDRIAEMRAALQQCVARADALERRLPEMGGSL